MLQAIRTFRFFSSPKLIPRDEAPPPPSPAPPESAPPEGADNVTSHNMSRVQQYARGATESHSPQRSGKGHSHGVTTRMYANEGAGYPPTSHPSARSNPAEQPKTSLTMASPPGRGPYSHLHRESNASMPPIGEPPRSTLPAPPTSSRRRANSEEHGGLWSPSLPSNLATPFDSPVASDEHKSRRQSRLEMQDGDSHDADNDGGHDLNRGLSGSRRATSHLAPLVLGADGKVSVTTMSLGENLARHHSMRNRNTNSQASGAGFGSENPGYSSSPSRHPTKLPIHDPNLWRSHPSQQIISSNGGKQDRAPSPTLDKFSISHPHSMQQKPRGPQRLTMFQEDDEYEDLNSNYPLSEDGMGTPRANATKAKGAMLSLRASSEIDGKMEPHGQPSNGAGTKRRRNTPDYDDTALGHMKYADLRNQPFDANPSLSSAATSTNGVAADASLPERLERCKTRGEREQKQLFAQMNLQDWESSGDWFLEQFGLLTQRLKEARRDKRAIAEKFEMEIAVREEAVRVRTDNIDVKLANIRNKGEAMLADKDV